MQLKELVALEEVAEAAGNLDQEVSGLTYDSRTASAGQVFFAIPGEKTDGHDFIGAAVKRGASTVVYSRAGCSLRASPFARSRGIPAARPRYATPWM